MEEIDLVTPTPVQWDKYLWVQSSTIYTWHTNIPKWLHQLNNRSTQFVKRSVNSDDVGKTFFVLNHCPYSTIGKHRNVPETGRVADGFTDWWGSKHKWNIAKGSVPAWCNREHDEVIKWKHFPALMALCEGNPPVTGGFPLQRPVTRSFNVSFDLRLKNGSANNRGASDLRRFRAQLNDVTVMETG